MEYRDLKYKLEVPNNCNLTNEDKFIHMYGQCNCKMLKFRDANAVIKIMNNYDDSCLDKKEKAFILKHSNEEVLCYICYINEAKPDIFIYGDDNIAFQTDCFI